MESPQPSSDGHTSGVGYPSLLRNVPYEVLSHIFVLCSCSGPVLLPYQQANVPFQVILSQVCSKWRQVALSTGALWGNILIFIDIVEDAHRLFLYRTWIDRAGAHPLNITIYLGDGGAEGAFQDFVLPFQIKMLDITLMYEKLPQLSDLPILNVEEFAISFYVIRKMENFAAPPFMNRTRSICLNAGKTGDLGESQVMLKKLCLPWHQLSSLECDSFAVPLSILVSVLPQAQSLEHCKSSIFKAERVPLVEISMPNLRRLTLTLHNVKPDIFIPLLATQNLTALCIYSSRGWSCNTYDIIKRHHRLHQLQEFQLHPLDFPTRIAQILVDAPLVRKLCVNGKPDVDAEALEGIASGRLGRSLSSLELGGCFDHTGEWLDMVEARQRHVKALVTQVSNWRQMITGLKTVEFREVKRSVANKKRAAGLKALGTTVTLCESFPFTS